MAFNWTLRIGLRDEQGLTTTLTFDLGTTAAAAPDAEFLAKYNSAIDIDADLQALTTANIYKFELSVRDDGEEDGSLPAEAEIAEEAAVAVHLAADPLPRKLHYLRIPAPIDGIFLADGVTVDTGNALLQAYVAELESEGVLVSDGESIIVARGDGGLHAGHLRFKARSTRK